MTPRPRTIVPAVLLLLLGATAAPAHRRVVLAVDGSGSMKDVAGTYSLSQSLNAFVEKLQPDDEIALITFEDRATLLRAPAPVGTTITALRDQVAAITFEGQHSDVPAALALACDVYPEGSAENPIDVLLVTDGVVTVRAPRNAEGAIKEMQSRIVPRCEAAGVRVHVIGLGGARARTEVLQSLAEATDGRSEFPLSADRLSGFLDAYLEATVPPPIAAPSASTSPRVERGSIATRGAAAGSAPAEDDSGRAVMLFLAAIGTALVALAAAIFAWRRHREKAEVASNGFVTLRERKSGMDHALRLPATLGRSPSSPIQLDDKEISRKHVRLELAGTKVAVVDLGSSNGTFVNGVRLKENESRILKPGDKLVLPGVEFLVQPEGFDADSTYIRQDLDRTFIRPTQPENTSR